MIQDLRFVKGDFEFGKFKLQMDKGNGWEPVPCVEEPKKDECRNPVMWWRCDKCSILEAGNFCGNCGSPRPKVEKKLWELLETMHLKNNRTGAADDHWKSMALAVMKSLEEKIEDFIITPTGKYGGIRDFKDFIRKKWLGKGGAK